MYVKFKKSGTPYGYAHFAGDEAEIVVETEAQKERYAKALDWGVFAVIEKPKEKK